MPNDRPTFSENFQDIIHAIISKAKKMTS